MFKPLVLIPSYNTGADLLTRTVREVLAATDVPVWVVIDGSTDGSERPLLALASGEPRLRILCQPRNRGKGAAVKAGTEAARAIGYSHALVMDADGQHPAESIATLLAAADTEPGAFVMGEPQFSADAPAVRLAGRKLTLWWTNLETLWGGLADTLFGMRVYPLEPLRRAFRQTPFARGFDFDPEIAVRLYWLGLPPRRIPVRCRYLSREEGGVSHFSYVRDNVKLTFLHFRLVPELLLYRIWVLLFTSRKT